MGTLAPPAYATQEDIYFNDNPLDVIEIGAVDAYLPQYPAADYTFYIVWDELNTVDQQRLINHVDRYGGTVPFGGPVAGFQVVDFFGDIDDGDSTGLDATPLAAGTTKYFYNPGIGGGDTTGLEEFNDDGLPEITKLTTRAADSSPTSLDGTFFTINSPTPTSYYVWYNTGVSVDPAPGGTGIQVDIHPNDTAKTVATKTANAVTAEADFLARAVGNTLFITTADDGVTADSTNGDTSFEIEKIQDGVGPTARTYTFTHHNGGFVDSVSVLGSAAPTFTDLLNEINPQMTNTTASIDVDGNIVFTTSGSGPTEYVWISDDDLFRFTTDNSYLGPINVGAGQYYVFHVEIDGVLNKYTIPGQDAPTYLALVTSMDAAMAGDATASIDNGDLVITSDTTGNSSSIVISTQPIGDPDFNVPPANELWYALSGFQEFNIPQHGAATFVDSLFLTGEYNGDVAFYTYAVRGIGDKPPVGGPNNTSSAVYFDGAAWVRLVDDQPI